MANTQTLIQGEKVQLRPFKQSDLPQVIAWRNDPEIRDGVLWPTEPFGLIEADRWLAAILDPTDHTRVTLAIDERETKRLVGQTNLSRIDRISKTAYFGIVLGERDCWGKGLARETLSLIIAHAKAIKIRKLLLEVVEYNVRAIELYKKFGFQTEGILREQTVRNGEVHDLILMALFLEKP